MMPFIALAVIVAIVFVQEGRRRTRSSTRNASSAAK